MNIPGLTDDETAMVIAAFPHTPHLGRCLLSVAKQKAIYENAEEKSKSVAASLAFMAAAMLLTEGLGDELLSSVYGKDPAPDAPNSEHLSVLADRLLTVWPLFLSENREAKSSFVAGASEIKAIAAGDSPQLFKAQAPTRGRPINAYRLAYHQQRALVWDAFFQSQGNKAADVQIQIGSAFGETWTTIARWKTQVVRELGSDTFERALREARRGLSPHIGLVRTPEEALSRLKTHGEQYQAEKRRRVQVL